MLGQTYRQSDWLDACVAADALVTDCREDMIEMLACEWLILMSRTIDWTVKLKHRPDTPMTRWNTADPNFKLVSIHRG